MVLYVLLTGTNPWRITGSETREETMRKIGEGRFDKSRPQWKGLSESARALIESLLIVNEKDRFTATDALRHGWTGLPAGSAPFTPSVDEELGSGMAVEAIRSMARFARLDSLQQMAMVACALLTSEASFLRRSAGKLWYKLFFRLDADEDGRLSPEEISHGLLQLLASDGEGADTDAAQLEYICRAVDVDGSEAIEWVEWVAIAMLSFSDLGQDVEPVQSAFRLLDRRADAGLSAVELLANAVAAAVTGDGDEASARLRAMRLVERWTGRTPSDIVETGDGFVDAPPFSVSDLRRAVSAAVGADDSNWTLTTRQATILTPPK